jgi:hypothetical protein
MAPRDWSVKPKRKQSCINCIETFPGLEISVRFVQSETITEHRRKHLALACARIDDNYIHGKFPSKVNVQTEAHLRSGPKNDGSDYPDLLFLIFRGGRIYI